MKPDLMDPRPSVSCIVIFHNEERYLAEAVDSILAQGYRDWELLLVDDGSTDASPAIAQAYAGRMPDRIRVLSHPGRVNRGMSATRNLGLKHARGRFVAFLDADDTWFPDKLAMQVAHFEAQPDAVMVAGATLYWCSWDPHAPLGDDRVVQTGAIDGVPALPLDTLYRPPRLVTELYPLRRGSSPSNSGIMVTRAAALGVGGFEESFRGIFEDQVFLLKIFLFGPVYVASDCYDRYRQHAESCVQVVAGTQAKEDARMRMYKWLDGHLHRIGCNDPQVHALLAEARRTATPTLTRRLRRAVRRVIDLADVRRPG